MLPLRLLLGLFEAGFFPGCVYLISTYYSRYDMQKRYAVFYMIGSLASACSGILAYGIQQMVSEITSIAQKPANMCSTDWQDTGDGDG